MPLLPSPGSFAPGSPRTRATLIRALRGRPLPRRFPGRGMAPLGVGSPQRMQDPGGFGILAPGPAGYYAPRAGEPSLMITDPELWARNNPPPSRPPLDPGGEYLGPGAAGHFGPGITPPALDPTGYARIAALVEQLFGGRGGGY